MYIFVVYVVVVSVRRPAPKLVFIMLLFADEVSMLPETHGHQRVVVCQIALVPDCFRVNSGIGE